MREAVIRTQLNTCPATRFEAVWRVRRCAPRALAGGHSAAVPWHDPGTGAQAISLMGQSRPSDSRRAARACSSVALRQPIEPTTASSPPTKKASRCSVIVSWKSAYRGVEVCRLAVTSNRARRAVVSRFTVKHLFNMPPSELFGERNSVEPHEPVAGGKHSMFALSLCAVGAPEVRKWRRRTSDEYEAALLPALREHLHP
jgi:hypothetical protein